MEKFLAMCLAAMVLLAGCTREELPKVKDGKITFQCSIKGVDSLTKGLNEWGMADINIYLVNEQGIVESHYYSINPQQPSCDIYSGHRYAIYSIANVGRSIPAGTLDELLELELPDIYFTTSCVPFFTVYGPYIFKDGQNVALVFGRLFSKVKVTADFSGLNEDVSIKMNKISLKNIKGKIKPFAENRAYTSADVKDGNFYLSPTSKELKNGFEMYLLENMQGTLLPHNTDQKNKLFPKESHYASICSYVEVDATYMSDEKEGNVTYRFYIGKDHYSNFDVERNTLYNLHLTFKGNGGIDENTWRVDVEDLEDVVIPNVEFQQNQRIMYDLETVKIPFAQLQGKGELDITTSDESVVQIIGYDNAGVKIKALAPGRATVTAKIGTSSAICNIEVEKLRIIPDKSSITMYNHFYEDVGYTVYPLHAASMEVAFSTSDIALKVGFNGVKNRIIPQYESSALLPATQSITVYLKERPDVQAVMDVVTNPVLTIAPSLTVNANFGSKPIVKDMNLKCAPRANVEFRWADNDGISIYGDPGNNIILNKDESTLTFPVPNGANGVYRLVAKVIGDDGYGSVEELHTDAVKYCDVSIYETIYLVGISKTAEMEKISTNPLTCSYTNEVVAKWYTHPNSLLYPNGELSLDYGFVYKGQTYTDSHTEFIEELVFTFEEGMPYERFLKDDPMIFEGLVPSYYIDCFYLQPAVSPYINGNMRDGTNFLYIYSYPFARGFSDDNSTGWGKIFEYIYK